MKCVDGSRAYHHSSAILSKVVMSGTSFLTQVTEDVTDIVLVTRKVASHHGLVSSVGDLVSPAIEPTGFGREVLSDPIRQGDLLPLAKGSG